ncbi:MAG TPA: inner membrane-spanning protein YciB [Caulobacteraceae bacterium]|jgi:intracellular septation protein|nr:inner membrane-spanning protein YciB [Caulobacteraceae bacterium]
MPTEHAAPSSRYHGLIRGLVDYGGLVAFAVAYFLRLRFVASAHGIAGWTLAMGGHAPRDITTATWWLVGGSALGLLIGLAVERRIAPMPLIAGGFALVFGALTLIFHNPEIIKYKPTISNLVFACALFGGLIMKRNPLGWLMGEVMPLPDEAWRKLTLRYAIFFTFMALLNEFVRRTQPNDVWVLFRFPGMLVLAMLFSVTQVPLMMKYLHSPQVPPTPME